MVRRKKKRQLNITLCIAGVLLCLTMISIYMMGGIYARYTTSAESDNKSRVAVMAEAVTVTIDENIPICPGETSIIPLTITNEKNGKVCEVAQQYVVNIRNLENNIPLEWRIYSDAECNNLIDQCQGTLAEAETEADNYWICVEWPSAANDASYAFEVDALEITVSVEQID